MSAEIETVAAFLARVEGIMADKPELRRGQAIYAALGSAICGANVPQIEWTHESVAAVTHDPFGNDSRIPAFLSAAVKAGVLREG